MCPRRRRQPRRHRRRLLRGPVRGDHRRGPRCGRPPRPRPARDEGAHADGRRAERRGPLAPPPHRRLRGEPAPPARRPHRPLPGARVGRAVRRSRRRSRRSTTSCAPGKVRYVGCSNYSGWQLMKALGISERHGFERFVSQQIHYTLQAREAEYEIVPAGLDQGVGIMVWSPLGRRPAVRQVPPRRSSGPEGARQLTDWNEPPVRDADALLRHRRRARRDRRGPRRLRGAGGDRLAARPPGRGDRW